MEQVLRLLAARLAEVILVECLNLGVKVRHAKSRLLVVGVETGGTRGAHFVRREARLTAAADTAAAARHDFDEVVARLDAVLDIFTDFVQHLLDVAHLVGDGDVDLRALDIDRRGLDAVHTTDRAELDRRRLILLGDEAVGRAKSRFHNAAGDAEDRAGTGVGAEQIIRRFIRKRHEVDTCGLDHAGEFTGRENDIRILLAGRRHRLVAGDLELLRRAGHDGGDVHLLAVDAVLLGPISLGESGEHLLRRLRGREVLGEVRRVLLHPVSPRGAAGGDERELAARREALDELRAFLHDGDVGGEVRIEHLVEAETAQRRLDLTGRKLAGLHAEIFAESDTHGRSDLNETDLLFVTESVPDLGGLVILVNRTDRAVSGALTALDAGRLGELDVGRRGHNRLFAAPDEFKRPHVLHLLAHFSAAAALDALVGIQNERRRGSVVLAVNDFLRERDIADAEIGGDVLKFAASAARALQTVARVVGENELKNRAADLDDVRIVGEDLHSFDRFRAAGAQKLRGGNELPRLRAARNELPDDAYAAACAGLEAGVVAQSRDLDVGFARGLEKVGALLNFDLDAVDFEFDHFHDKYFPFLA